MQLDKKASVYISLALSITLTLIFILALFFLPTVLNGFIYRFFELPGSGLLWKIVPEITPGGYLLLLFSFYLLDCLGLAASVCLTLLVVRILKGLVFTEKSVFLLRVISWLCIFAAIVFILPSLYFFFAFCAVFAAALLGIVLRVVKNVIEEATRIKSENDFTV